MSNEKVKEIQDYLKTKGYVVAETSIVDMAIDLTRRLGAEEYTFLCEHLRRKEKAGEEQARQRDG